MIIMENKKKNMNNRFDFKSIKTPNDYMLLQTYNHQIFTGNYIGKMGYEQYLFNINIGYIPKDSIYLLIVR